MSSIFLSIWQLSLVLSSNFFYIARALNILLGKLQNNLLIVPSMRAREIQWCGSYVLALFIMDITCAIIPLLYITNTANTATFKASVLALRQKRLVCVKTVGI